MYCSVKSETTLCFIRGGALFPLVIANRIKFKVSTAKGHRSRMHYMGDYSNDFELLLFYSILFIYFE